MVREVSEIEAEIRGLDRSAQEHLLRALLDALDGPSDPDVERIWLDEVQRRSAELDAGLVKPISADEVFARVRSQLKR